MQINITKNSVDRMPILFHMLLPTSCASKWYQWLRIWLSRNIRFVGVNVGMSARNRRFQTNYWCITSSTTFGIAHAPCYTRTERATQSAARVGSSLFDFLTVPSTHYVPKIVFAFSPICRACKNSIAICLIIIRDLNVFLCIGPHQQSAIETSGWLW